MLVIESKALCHAVSLTVHSNIVNALMLVHIYWSFFFFLQFLYFHFAFDTQKIELNSDHCQSTEKSSSCMVRHH